MFLIRSGCSGVGSGVLDMVRVFWSWSGCSGIGEGVLVKVRVFWSGCGYSV